MKLRSNYAICLLGISFLLSCGSTKKIKSDDTAVAIESKQIDSTDNYRLIVSFFSPGNGIDHKMNRKFSEFLASNYPKLIYERAQWGKEGERDYCFLLKELTQKKKDQFVRESKELLAASSRVHVYENAPCRHKKAK